MTREQAIVEYREARAAYYAACASADRAFARWFSGEANSAATVSRLENKAMGEKSVALYCAQGELYKLDVDPWDIDDEDGVDRTPVGS